MNPFREVYLKELTGKQSKIDVNHNGKIEGSDLAALRAKKKGMKKEETQVQEEAMGKGGKVETKKYSWGTMKTVHHGADFSIPLHPEHHQAISKLKDNQEHKFKDETGKHWTAKRMGDNVHFQGANNGGKTHVPHSTMHEETEIQEAERPGLYANINAKRERIKHGSNERMRKPGSKGAPSAQDFKDAAKTAKESKEVYSFLKRLNEGMKKCPECGEKMEKGKCSCCGYSEKNEKMEEAANAAQQAAIAIAKKKSGKYDKEGNKIKEEVEPIDELTKSTIEKYKDKVYTDYRNNYRKDETKRTAGVKAANKRLLDKSYGVQRNRTTSEEVEHLEEANHREFASKGMMHPDMAKHMTVGQEHDYYEHGTGDKVSGKVIKKTDTEVHMKQTHDSYDPKKKGTVHKFKIGSSLPEEYEMNEELVQEDLEITLTQEEFDAIAEAYMGFEKTTKALAAKGAKNPKALAAWIGRNKYGKKKFQAAAAKGKKLGEEVEDLDEKINMKTASMGDIIKDFKKSDAPQFAGKSAEKRRQMAIAAKLGAKNEETTSFKGFLEKLDEIKMSDLPSRKVSGKYGTEYYKNEKEKDEKGYDDEESSSPSEKRGRGRPAGSKSGARQKGSTTGKKRSGVEMTGYPLHLPNSK